MPKVKNPDYCYVCGMPLTDDHVSMTVPASFSFYSAVLLDPGVVELRFCCDRHKRDWADGHYGIPDEK